MMVNSTLAYSQNCQFQYNPANGSFYLYSDTSGWLGPLLPGSSGVLNNGLCSVLGTGTSAASSATAMRLNVAMSFAATFAGAKNVYLLVQEGAYGVPSLTSGWQQQGTWIVQE